MGLLPKLTALSVVLIGTLVGARGADAGITKIEITTHESPTFGGYSWPGVGQYEKLVGKAYGEVDPNDPQNAIIVDVEHAPRNARGHVEYAFDFYILKPINLQNGAHKVLYEPPNRGAKTWQGLNNFPNNTNDPGSVTDPTLLAGTFLMPLGYTVVFSGWDQSAGTNNANFNSTITLPIAKNRDGSSITGPSYEYIVTSGTNPYTLTYPAANLDQTQAKLTHRVHLDDQPVEVPASNWSYNAAGTQINLSPAGWVANDIYEFSYTAKDPTVNGLGLAAVRDWVDWLRYQKADSNNVPNPIAGDVQRVYTETVSQPARFLNDFDHLGFNRSEQGRKVFDGHLNWIGAGDGIALNYRFSQPTRTERNRQHHLYPEGVFPFANVVTTDPFTGKRDGRFVRCEATHTCPLAVEIYSANEYWVKAASLLTTTPDGKYDLPDSPYARNYFMSSMQHGTGDGTSRGVCQQLQNPLDSSPVQRALFLALDAWATTGRQPPPSRVPRLADRTLAPPLPQSRVGFPNIPGVTYTGLKTTRYLFNFGGDLHTPDFYDTGIMTINPPVITMPYEDNPANGPIYPSFVPTTDRDGNDIAGIRLPDVSVPLATYTGWALRSGVWANDGCEGSGQYIPFPQTAADRISTGDPRLSVEERYPTYRHYAEKVTDAIDDLVRERLLLCEEATTQQSRLLTAGEAAGVPAPGANEQPPTPRCLQHGHHGW
jgi:hypothetical protein